MLRRDESRVAGNASLLDVVKPELHRSSDVGLKYQGQTVTNAEAWFNVALRPQKP